MLNLKYYLSPTYVNKQISGHNPDLSHYHLGEDDLNKDCYERYFKPEKMEFIKQQILITGYYQVIKHDRTKAGPVVNGLQALSMAVRRF